MLPLITTPTRIGRRVSAGAALRTGAILSLAVAPLAMTLTGCTASNTPAAQSVSSAATPTTRRSNASVVEEMQSLWQDPEFQKAFLGTYGINAAIEPRLSPEEITFLEKLRPHMEKDLKKAQAMLESEIKSNKTASATLYMTLGNIYFQTEKMDLAEQSYNKAVEKHPSFRRAWRNLGLIHVRAARYDQAISSFTKMIELGGGDGPSYGLLGFAYASKQDYQAAETAYRNALLLQPDETEWRLGLTRCVFKQNKFEDANNLLATLIERYPDKTEFWLLQAHTYLGLKKPLNAAANLEAVQRMGKATPDAMYSLGDIYMSENLPDPAVRSYQRAIELDSNQSPTRPLRSAEVLAARGWLPQSREVAAELRKALEPKMQAAERRRLLKLEARLSMAEGNGGDEAVKALEEIVKLDPLDGEALMLLGQHFSSKQKPDQAIFWYERAENIDNFEANAKLRHAQVLRNAAVFRGDSPAAPLPGAQAPRRRRTLSRASRSGSPHQIGPGCQTCFSDLTGGAGRPCFHCDLETWKPAVPCGCSPRSGIRRWCSQWTTAPTSPPGLLLALELSFTNRPDTAGACHVRGYHVRP